MSTWDRVADYLVDHPWVLYVQHVFFIGLAVALSIGEATRGYMYASTFFALIAVGLTVLLVIKVMRDRDFYGDDDDFL